MTVRDKFLSKLFENPSYALHDGLTECHFHPGTQFLLFHLPLRTNYHRISPVPLLGRALVNEDQLIPERRASILWPELLVPP